MATISTDEKAPGAALMWTDLARGVAEFGSLAWTWPLLASAPRGDGHPVLVLPGLASGDYATIVLRRYLRFLGYRTYRWKLGINVGPTADIVAGMPARLAAIATSNDQPVSIVGWSLGGIFAHQLARKTPESVRQVITLGSPIRLQNHEHTNARWLYGTQQRRHSEAIELPLGHGLGPLPVPASSVYSRLDGVVSWRACLDESSELTENIEVRAAHFGLGVHPAVLFALADRLAQPAGQWRPYQSPHWLQFAYPTPATRENHL